MGREEARGKTVIQFVNLLHIEILNILFYNSTGDIRERNDTLRNQNDRILTIPFRKIQSGNYGDGDKQIGG